MNTRNNNSRNSNYRNQNYGTRNENYRYGNQDYSYNDQCHVHEVIGSTAAESECSNCHNHRFCTMSSEPIAMGDSHVHEIKFRTDFVNGHYHEYCGRSSKAVSVGNGKHIHYASDFTESENDHKHRFQVASAIDSPQEFKSCDTY